MNNIQKALQSLDKLNNGKSERQEHEVYQPFQYEKKKNTFVLTKSILWRLFNTYTPEGYVIDSRNEKIIFTLLRYFLRDPDFNEYKLIHNDSPALEKGILIYGDYGVGKSQLFEIIRTVGKELIVNKNCNLLWFSHISAGSFVDEYMAATKDEHSTFKIENYYTGKLYIDDLGFEKQAFNRTELFGELLFERNRKKALTYVTTNLKPSELTKRYGERIGDRLPEMFNILKWEGKSFRE